MAKLEDLFILCQEPKYRQAIINIDLKGKPRSLLSLPGSTLTQADIDQLFHLKIELVYNLVFKYQM